MFLKPKVAYLPVQQRSADPCLVHASRPEPTVLASRSTSRIAVGTRKSGLTWPAPVAVRIIQQTIMASRQQPPKKRDRTNENCDKAVKNIMWRCEQIRRRYGADVYVQVRFKSKHYEYTSSSEHHFPKSRAELKEVYPVLVGRSPLDYAERKSRSEVQGESGVRSC
ncbi:hypothetical protein CABS01_15536 [Colletotrichum abscissum]|uniref:uncharacterized protein n=1 Tax=Colletotrichum abscissum TaxID=1671311 RepID=UPI0027D5E123|nr:uncharacterized protein CABS01_15536 [Colletotrichum abscissum]KAK1475967.1 hypothetical protein CABS01_15536 [Colletotrichum abscissum]